MPKFRCTRQLGDVSTSGLQTDDDDDGHLRSASSSAAAADDSESVVSVSRSANDSSMLDMDMDETC